MKQAEERELWRATGLLTMSFMLLLLWCNITGSGSSALHLAVWGAVDTARDALDMRIGLPASTLLKAGIKNLPNSYVLPIAVTGRLDKPQIDWPVAVRKLAVLSAMQLGRDALRDSVAGQKQQPGTTASVQQGLAGLFGVANRALTNAASSFIGQVRKGEAQHAVEIAFCISALCSMKTILPRHLSACSCGQLLGLCFKVFALTNAHVHRRMRCMHSPGKLLSRVLSHM